MKLVKRIVCLTVLLLSVITAIAIYDLTSVNRAEGELLDIAKSIVNSGDDIDKAKAKLILLEETKFEYKSMQLVAWRLFFKDTIIKWRTYEEITIEFQNNVAIKCKHYQYEPAGF